MHKSTDRKRPRAKAPESGSQAGATVDTQDLDSQVDAISAHADRLREEEQALRTQIQSKHHIEIKASAEGDSPSAVEAMPSLEGLKDAPAKEDAGKKAAPAAKDTKDGNTAPAAKSAEEQAAEQTEDKSEAPSAGDNKEPSATAGATSPAPAPSEGRETEPVTSSTENTPKVDTVTAKNPASSSESATQKAISSLKGKTSMLTALSVVLLLGLGGGGFYTYTTLEDLKAAQASARSAESAVAEAQAAIARAGQDLNGMRSQVSSLIADNQELSSLNAALREDNESLRKSIEGLASEHDSLKLLSERLDAFEARNPHDWRIAEGYFCINNAYLKAVMGNDIATALWNLRQGDLLLTNIEDENVLKIRSAIAEDISALEKLPAIDLFGVRERLENVLSSIDELTLKGYSVSDTPYAADKEPTSAVEQWKENLLTSAKEFSSRFVEVRRRAPDEATDFLSPQQELFVRENIKTRLVMALSAISTRDAAAYVNHLSEASRMVEAYFAPESPVTEATLKALNELKDTTVVVKAPDTLLSYALFSAFMKERFEGRGE